MHYDDGQLMAYLDSELPAEQRAQLEAHLGECAECSVRRDELATDRALVTGALAQLDGSRDAEVVTLPSAAASTPGDAAAPARTRAASRFARGRWIAAAAAVLVLGSFAFAPVRGAAASLLQVFRVQQVQTITISQDDLSQMAAAVKQGGHVDLKSFGEAWVDGAGSRAATVTLAQAQAALDFPVKLPSAEATQPVLILQKARTYRFKLHVAAINQALQYYGAEKVLPASVDGKVFTVSVPPILVAQYPAPASLDVTATPRKMRGVYFGQARSPELTVPDGVDAAELRDVLLDLPFVPQSVRDQLGAVQNWQSTLLIPNVNGAARQITIDGIDAVVVSPNSAIRDMRKQVPVAPKLTDNATVIWNDNGVVRAVGGPLTEEQAIALAKSAIE